MGINIKYLDCYGKEISRGELKRVENYLIQTFVGSMLKKEEEVLNNEFWSGKYFLHPGENISQVFLELSINKNNNWVFYSNKEVSGNFTLWDWAEYNKTEEVIFRGKVVLDNHNRKIFTCSLELNSDHLKDEARKYFYGNNNDNEGEVRLLSFTYNAMGQTCSISDDNDNWGYFVKPLSLDGFLNSSIVDDFIWGDHPYYHSLHPFLPKGKL